ncbi:hypothetical protein [Bifidobacterium moukalabense]|uniref:hypothetical protein n=1 Tax=Bifidobacterium moukalabense TaxID=1333651 RepID=UPI001F29805D|nr:hypothetical protein [Bifidobacterium moukalabense]
MPNMIFFLLRLLDVLHFIRKRHFGHSFSSLILISGSLIALFMNDTMLFHSCMLDEWLLPPTTIERTFRKVRNRLICRQQKYPHDHSSCEEIRFLSRSHSA